ncbi:MAG: methyltransferase domain-containing protein [Methylococcales bacterium]|nr:methyltransferase domain-containing protein [Methylococcales bacterium]MDP3840595.1 methyltransferase domain-containing protein [Methylococcales bacterium]
MKLHLGSGKVKLNGWQNVDLDAPEADMHLDLREKLPFGDQLITHIYNEHFIEHITREESVSLLKECHRVLKNDGVLRLSTPNLKYIAVAYLSRNITEWQDVSWQPKTPCLLINEAVRLWGHQFVYDAEELVKALIEAGFNSVQFVNYGESADKELIGLETRPFHHELIVEARKDNSGIGIPCTSSNEYDDNEVWLDKVNKSVLKQIKLSQQTISDQSINILNLEEKLANCEQQLITEREQHIAERDHRIAELTAHIDILTTHLSTIEAEIISRGQHIITIESDLVLREADLVSCNQRITDLNTHIHNLDAHIHNLEVEIIKLHSSLCRKLISAARRLSK